MSQQINLLLPELRPKFDWLGLPVVLALALTCLLGLVAIAQGQAGKLDGVKRQAGLVAAEVGGLQQQLQLLAQTLRQRQGDASLPQKIAVAKIGLADRQEVLSFVGTDDQGRSPAFGSLLQGFSRQSMPGVWLVGFDLTPETVEIRGRLLDPALLPAYISRLNTDLAFVGRRFAALEMKAVDPAVVQLAAPQANARPAVGGRYTEFALRTDPLALAGTRP